MTRQRLGTIAITLMLSSLLLSEARAASRRHSTTSEIKYGADYYKNHPDKDPNRKPATQQAPTSQPDVAHENILSARKEVARTSKAYDDVVKKLTADFEQSPDMTAARQALADATSKFQAGKAPVLASLQNKPGYQQAVKKRDDAEKKLAELRASAAAQEQVATAASALMSARQDVSTLEAAALASDPTLKPLHKAMDDAQAKVTQLHADFRDSLKNNPDVASAQKARDDATAQLDQAQEKVAKQ